MTKKHKQNKPIRLFEKRTLDSVSLHFKEVCEKCNEPLQVHAYRAKSQTKKEAIYASCINKGKCGRYHLEICFIEKFF